MYVHVCAHVCCADDAGRKHARSGSHVGAGLVVLLVILSLVTLSVVYIIYRVSTATCWSSADSSMLFDVNARHQYIYFGTMLSLSAMDSLSNLCVLLLRVASVA